MSNLAAVLRSAKAHLELKSLPLPTLTPGEVLIKNAAIGLNPIEAKIARLAVLDIKYPAILGATVGGTIMESQNPRFKAGDRVMAYLPRFFTGDNRNGAFQSYSVGDGVTMVKIPDELPFEKAAAYPMTAVTAASSLFEVMGLSRPVEWRKPAERGETLLIWGGSTSVGGYAVQWAVMAGYKVVSTASPHNHNYVRSLGAAEVYDHSDPFAPAAIAKHGPFTGILDTAGFPACHNAILEALKHIPAPEMPKGTIYTLLPPKADEAGWPEEVKRQMVYFNITLEKNAGFREWIWGEGGMMESLVTEGRLKETPVEVIGGLEELEEGLERVVEGVSARKLVVVL